VNLSAFINDLYLSTGFAFLATLYTKWLLVGYLLFFCVKTLYSWAERQRLKTRDSSPVVEPVKVLDFSAAVLSVARSRLRRDKKF